MNHMISNEADRNAYQAVRNIQRFQAYQHKRKTLERLQEGIAQSVMEAFPMASMDDLERAIKTGWHALESGHEFDTALQQAKEVLTCVSGQ